MSIKNEIRWLIIICLVAFAVFANGLSGNFVYDDNQQILRNPLIQDSTLYSKALTVDVWAFKGDGTIAASNYYRPTFILWLIINFLLFGTSPFGWHLLNLLLHIAICALGYLLLRRWKVENQTAFAITLIFAAHPVHTESVVWISGSPDLLFGIFLFCAFWFAENYSTKSHEKSTFFSRLDLPLALIFYAFALGSKEIGILCFPLFYFIFKNNQINFEDNNPRVSASPFLLVVPFIALAILYFAARWLVLRAISLPPEDGGAPFYQAVLSTPQIFVFYLRQMLFPLWLGANYPLRSVSDFSLLEFILPLVISLAALSLFWLLAKKSFVQKFGFALFILTLSPAMNAMAFHTEQIVHDRYLYLPLFGFLMMIFPYLSEIIDKIAKNKNQIAVILLAIIVSLPLFLKTISYNQVWKNELALWSHAVTIDEKSAFNWAQYASVLSENGKIDEAVEAYDNSLDVRPSANAYYGKARNLLAQNKFEEAIFDLKTVIEMPNEKLNAYTLYQTYELIAIALTHQAKFTEAQKYLFDSRKRLPIYYAALTEKLAVIMYQAGEKTSALRELESAEKQAKTELLPESKRVLLRLGMLYAEMNRKEEAREFLGEYLRLTIKIKEKGTLQDRITAANLLKQLN
jgi:tetratricopeptide (TPR) repeat protein